MSSEIRSNKLKHRLGWLRRCSRKWKKAHTLTMQIRKTSFFRTSSVFPSWVWVSVLSRTSATSFLPN